MKLNFLMRTIAYKSAFNYVGYTAYLLRKDNKFRKAIFVYSTLHRPNAGFFEDDVPVRIYVPYKLVKL